MDDLILGIRRAEKSVWDREDAKSDGFRLSDGEPGYDKTNHIIKIGDGVSKFADLPSIRGSSSTDDALLTDSTEQTKYGNLFAGLNKSQTGQRSLGVSFYVNDEKRTLYLMYNSSTNFSALYHSKFNSLISINEENGEITMHTTALVDVDFIRLKNQNIYTTTDGSLGKYGISLNNSDIIGANAIVFADECDGTQGLLFPKQGITSGPSTARKPSDFYILRGYREELYFAGSQVITTKSKSSWMLNSSLNLDATDGTWRGYQIRYTVPGTSDQYDYYIGANTETGYLNLASNNPDIGDILRCKMDGSEKIFNGTANTAKSVPASGVTGTLSIAHGGTGSTTAAGARSNLATPQVVNDENNYWQLKQPNGNDMSYMRTPPSGIIPASQGAGGNIGTSSWKFHSMYAQYGYFDNITGGIGWMKVGSQLICWGTFTKPYNASSGTSSNYYGDMSGKVNGYLTEYPVAFSSVPISISITCNQATTQIVNLELDGYNRYGITNVRVHRTSAFNDTAGLKVSWIALGPA